MTAALFRSGFRSKARLPPYAAPTGSSSKRVKTRRESSSFPAARLVSDTGAMVRARMRNFRQT